MTPLREEFVSTLRLKNYSPKTIKQYTLSVARFARYFGCCPSKLGKSLRLSKTLSIFIVNMNFINTVKKLIYKLNLVLELV